jgi:hypothetical protein
MSPTTGSRAMLRIRDVVTEYNRADIYHELLAVLGIQHVTNHEVSQRLDECMAAFDLAVQVRRTPHGFQHKLNAHQRPYLVNACQSLIGEGNYLEAMSWLLAFYVSSVQVILVDGSEADKLKYAEILNTLMHKLGFNSPAAEQAAIEGMRSLCDLCFTLASEIMATNPDIKE